MREDSRTAIQPARRSTRQPVRSNFWENYGWNTTLCVSAGIGGFGMLRLLVGLATLSTHPILDAAELVALMTLGPLLGIVGLTGFLLALHNLVRHCFVDE